MCCRGSGYITASMAFVAFPLYANNLRELVEGYWGGRKGLKKKKIQAYRPPRWCSPFSLSHCLLALVLLLKVAKSRSTIPFSGFDSFVSR